MENWIRNVQLDALKQFNGYEIQTNGVIMSSNVGTENVVFSDGYKAVLIPTAYNMLDIKKFTPFPENLCSDLFRDEAMISNNNAKPLEKICKIKRYRSKSENIYLKQPEQLMILRTYDNVLIYFNASFLTWFPSIDRLEFKTFASFEKVEYSPIHVYSNKQLHGIILPVYVNRIRPYISHKYALKHVEFSQNFLNNSINKKQIINQCWTNPNYQLNTIDEFNTLSEGISELLIYQNSIDICSQDFYYVTPITNTDCVCNRDIYTIESIDVR